MTKFIGVAGAAPAASRQFGANQTDVFAVDENGQLFVFFVEGNGAWHKPRTIGPTDFAIPGASVAVSQQFGTTHDQTDVFVIDKTGQLNVFWVVEQGPWQGPLKIGTAQFFLSDYGTPSPVASQRFGTSNQTDVYAVDDSGQLNVFSVVGEGTWQGPAKIGPAGFAASGASLAVSERFGANGQTDVFVMDNSGQLNVFSVVGDGAWQAPVAIGTPTYANLAPPAVSRQFGTAQDQTDVFVVDLNGLVNVFWASGTGSWQGPKVLAGQVGEIDSSTGLQLAASQQFGADQTDVFAVDLNGQLNVFSVVGDGAWHGPKVLGPPGQTIVQANAAPAVSRQFGTVHGQTDVFMIGAKGDVVVFWFNYARGGGWNETETLLS